MQFERIIAGAIVAAALGVGGLTLHAEIVPDKALVVPAEMVLPLSAKPLPLNHENPAQDRVGALRFMGAVQLRSSNRLFGGLSGLRAGPGNRLLSVSDTGNWVAFDTVERGGLLLGVENGVIAPIRQPDGKVAPTKQDGDSEALEWDPVSGEATIVYEQDHRLVHFNGIDADRPATLDAIPARTERLTAMTGWALNSGGEAMAVLPNGQRIVIAEVATRPDNSHVALLTIAGKTVEIGVGGAADHAPTDAIALDDHRILVLNRRFSPMAQSAVLTLVDLAPALAGETVAPMPARELARIVPPMTVDNMEGLAIRRVSRRIWIYLVSDDNLNGVQRTLLMKFELIQ